MTLRVSLCIAEFGVSKAYYTHITQGWSFAQPTPFISSDYIRCSCLQCFMKAKYCYLLITMTWTCALFLPHSCSSPLICRDTSHDCDSTLFYSKKSMISRQAKSKLNSVPWSLSTAYSFQLNVDNSLCCCSSIKFLTRLSGKKLSRVLILFNNLQPKFNKWHRSKGFNKNVTKGNYNLSFDYLNLQLHLN